MENNDTDKLTRSILASSKLEINNPDFTLNLMGKIKAENRRKTIMRQSIFYLLLFISIDAAILTLIKLFGISFADLSLSIGSAAAEIVKASSGKGNVLLIYLLFQTIAIFAMIGISGSRTEFLNKKNG